MTEVNRRIHHLPDNINVTVLRTKEPAPAAVLRAMLAAELYVICGHTSGPTGTPSGYGAYVGTSEALRVNTLRVGVSLRNWTYRLGRIEPDAIILIRREGRAIPDSPRLLIEASLARTISGSGYTLLNTRTSAPTAAQRANRQQRLWALHIASRLAELIHGQILWRHTPAAAGGSTREQLVRLVLAQNPPRGMNVDDILAAAADADITINGGSPAQRSRRDVTTREHDSGGVIRRLHRTSINGRTVIYPASLPLREARATYRSTHPAQAGKRVGRRPANRAPAR